MPNKLTEKRLRELFHYDEKTGDLVRKITTSSRSEKGVIAGNLDKYGYLQISIGGYRYLVHRVIWLYYYGYFPENGIDHINRIKTDNRLENLREVSHSCNMRNRNISKRNKSGINGIVFDYDRNRWKVSICNNGRSVTIGRFKILDNAACARLAAEQCLDWSGCDSSSTAYKYVQKMLMGA